MATGTAPVVDVAPATPWGWARDLVVEMIGTLTLVFVAAGSIVATGGKDVVVAGLAPGLAIAVMVAATGHFTGGAFNPAVVLALAIGRRIVPARALGYVLAQLIGAVSAALLLKAVFPSPFTSPVKLGLPEIGGGFSPANAFLAEVIASFFLAYVIFGVAIDKRGAATIAALAIGLCVTMDVYAVGPVSGAAMNPARWFGPAAVQGNYDNAWVWIVGPLVGGALAAVVYFYGYLRGPATDTEMPGDR